MKTGVTYLLAGWLIVGSATRGEVGPGSGSNPETADEAVHVMMELYGENQRLKEQVVKLTEQVAGLEKKLAEAMMKIDGLRGGEVAEEAAPAVTTPDVSLANVAKLTVVEVNRRMGVAVVRGGARDGLKPGMRFSVVRGDDVIATIRLVDVRADISGGLIERTERDRYPENGDRLVLSSKQDG